MALPGAVNDDELEEVHTSTVGGSTIEQKHTDGQKKSRCPVYTARVWEPCASQSWRETHRFHEALEVDLAEESASIKDGGSKDSPHSLATCVGKVHLPTTSLRALLMLQESLAKPSSVLLDLGEGMMTLQELFSKMLASLEEAACGNSLQEAELMLNDHPYMKQESSEDGYKIEGETAEIFLCPCNSLDASQKPILVLARLRRTAMTTVKHELRFVIIVLCSKASAMEPSLGQELSRAVATTFMNEEFVVQAREVTKDSPELVIKALEQYLATLTIVPTVHMADGSRVKSLLSDSLVTGMQKRISEEWGENNPAPVPVAPIEVAAPESQVPAFQIPSQKNTQYFVETNKFSGMGTGWRVERRLRQGLELDVASGEERPHLPRVSANGLQQVRKLLNHNSVLLDVLAGTSSAAVKAVVSQLSRCGLPAAAAQEVSQALQERADQAEKNQTPKSGAVTPMADDIKPADLVKPSREDETCLVLTVLGANLPAESNITAALLRLKTPLKESFSSSKAPVRFLAVLVAPKVQADRVASVGESLAALAVDEDLMLNLSDARDVVSFVNAIDSRLNDLVLLPHAHLHHYAKHHKSHSKKSLSSTSEQRAPKSPKHSDPVPPDEGGPIEAMKPKKKGKNKNGIVLGTDLGFEHMQAGGPGDKADIPPWKRRMHHFVMVAQKYALPLVLGVVIALIWKNTDSDSYEKVTHEAFHPDLIVYRHPVGLHFLVNDIFMCFFFGLAIKEVTEALLPGGSLNPLKRAANPLMATLGGVLGPVAVYIIMVFVLDAAGGFDGAMCVGKAAKAAGGDAHRRLAAASASSSAPHVHCKLSDFTNGWGVPTATDISLAWMFALVIFGCGHPAINFLLLLAIADDALGMMIIAVAYPDPVHPVEPVWLLLVVAGALVAFLLRMVNCQFWSAYVWLAGPISWHGLILAGVHPALTLTVIVPFMPGGHHNHKLHDKPHKDPEMGGTRDDMVHRMWSRITAYKEAPLHVFEEHTKLLVDFGMFFFGLCNAGVKLGALGGVTIAVVVALVIGKTIGIASFALIAECMGFDLPVGLTKVDLFSLSALGGVGLTVALFVSNEAFQDPDLRGQSKMGALFSTGGALLAYIIKVVGDKIWPPGEAEDDAISNLGSEGDEKDVEATDEDYEDEADDWLDELAVDDLMTVLWTQRRFARRGLHVPIGQVARSVSKGSARPPSSQSARPALPSKENMKLQDLPTEVKDVT
eukprot:TRINITY_DN26097_c0_g1_i1.p1 TRINITY_DN26097_c0_g1~~TRINITY_DN26097_c0_g1_i1.p1  ORF type:complete len:1219 (-),score=240.97 TRINITY_DN26097_c0_g1_i1:63-3719(-)